MEFQGITITPVLEAPATTYRTAEMHRVDAIIRRTLDAGSYRLVFSKVEWQFENGRLTLQGRVPSFYLKQVLQEMIRGIEEVEQIRNDVDVVSANGLSSEPQKRPR